MDSHMSGTAIWYMSTSMAILPASQRSRERDGDGDGGLGQIYTIRFIHPADATVASSLQPARQEILKKMDKMLQDVSRTATRCGINLDGQIECDESQRPLCGGFADVYRGTERRTGRQVAIKAIRADFKHNVSAIKRALKEVHLWSTLEHENILPLRGVTTDFHFTVSIVSPWMQTGNAFDHVQDKNVDPRPLLIGIASGLNYLHTRNPPICHGDLKGTNVLVAPDGNAVLADFGLSSLVCSPLASTMSTSFSGGTVRWMAPEIMTDSDSRATVEGDIWAFGMTTLELFTREAPFAAIPSVPAVVLKVMHELPDRPSSESTLCRMTEEWWNMCLACWHRDARQRPLIRELLAMTKNVQETISLVPSGDAIDTFNRSSSLPRSVILDITKVEVQESFEISKIDSPDVHIDTSYGSTLSSGWEVLGHTHQVFGYENNDLEKGIVVPPECTGVRMKDNELMLTSAATTAAVSFVGSPLGSGSSTNSSCLRRWIDDFSHFILGMRKEVRGKLPPICECKKSHQY
ncbi:kinase-like domain-containing protein [Scleroderma citrinum]